MYNDTILFIIWDVMYNADNLIKESWHVLCQGSFCLQTMEDTQVEPRTKTLANGAVYDLDKKRIVSGALLTSDKAKELVQVRIERKRERIIAGANAALGKSQDWEAPQDMDFVEAIAEVAAMKALNPDDPKSIEAAKFLLQEAGLSFGNSQRENEPAPPGAVSMAPDTLVRLAAALEAEIAARVDQARAIDVDATDTRNE